MTPAERLTQIRARNRDSGRANYQPRNWRMARTIAASPPEGTVSTAMSRIELSLSADESAIVWRLPADVAPDSPERALFNDIDRAVATAQQAATDANQPFGEPQMRATIENLMRTHGILAAQQPQAVDPRLENIPENFPLPPPPASTEDASQVEEVSQDLAPLTTLPLTMQAAWAHLRTINPNLRLPADAHLQVRDDVWSLADEAEMEQTTTSGPPARILQNFLHFMQSSSPRSEDDVAAAARLFGLVNDPEAAADVQDQQSSSSNLGANTYWWQEAYQALGAVVARNTQDRWEPQTPAAGSPAQATLIALANNLLAAQNRPQRLQQLQAWCIANSCLQLYTARFGAEDTAAANGAADSDTTGGASGSSLARTPSQLTRSVAERSANHRSSRAGRIVQTWNEIRRFTGEPEIQFVAITDGEWSYVTTRVRVPASGDTQEGAQQAAQETAQEAAQEIAQEYVTFSERVDSARSPEEKARLIAERFERLVANSSPVPQPQFWGHHVREAIRGHYFMARGLLPSPVFD
ncbi:MAG: hypothetical protein ACRC7P_10040, partial [Enterovibrio sp.]